MSSPPTLVETLRRLLAEGDQPMASGKSDGYTRPREKQWREALDAARAALAAHSAREAAPPKADHPDQTCFVCGAERTWVSADKTGRAANGRYMYWHPSERGRQLLGSAPACRKARHQWTGGPKPMVNREAALDEAMRRLGEAREEHIRQIGMLARNRYDPDALVASADALRAAVDAVLAAWRGSGE